MKRRKRETSIQLIFSRLYVAVLGRAFAVRPNSGEKKSDTMIDIKAKTEVIGQMENDIAHKDSELKSLQRSRRLSASGIATPPSRLKKKKMQTELERVRVVLAQLASMERT